jgi:hypothetical protein
MRSYPTVPSIKVVALSGLGLMYLASASCWINQPPVACPEVWIRNGETCSLKPSGQTFMYANQCGEGDLTQKDCYRSGGTGLLDSPG